MGVEHLEESERALHRQLFLSRQLSEGGFSGRAGRCDLYYTAFALRALVLLGESDSHLAPSVANYLREQTKNQNNIIDLISLLFAARLLETWAGVSALPEASTDWTRSVANRFEQLRRPDGGYAKTVKGHASSTYQTFLIALAYQLLEIPFPEVQKASTFILGQQRDDGGFVEICVMQRSGTNPTAAAIGALRVLQSQHDQTLLTSTVKEHTARFLALAKTSEGGFRANTQIPVADLLSTYTALQTLRDLDCWNHVDTDAALRYVRALQHAEGGFRAAAWDDAVDVEYSFYGVASLGLLLAATENRAVRKPRTPSS